MGNVTKSQQNNITSPNGNSLALFVEGATGVMKVKDVMGNIQPLSDFVGCQSPFQYDTNNTGIKPILGGNEASGQYSTVGGGKGNFASGNNSFVGGGYSNGSIGSCSVILGGYGHNANCDFETIGGGYINTTSGGGSTIGGGIYNNASGQESTISGGRYNVANGNGSFIGGGGLNIATQQYGTVSGGYCNCACSSYSTISGGFCNVITGNFSSVLGGRYNDDKGFCNVHLIGSCLDATQNDTTFMNCASVQNLTVGRMVCVGANKVLENAPTSVNFGLFSQTASSVPIADSTVEGTLINGGVGSLSVAPNGFSVGDSFNANMSGIMSANNGNDLRIRIKSGSVVLADSGDLTMPSITNQVWSLNLQFTIRAIGGVGVASIATTAEMLVLKLASGTQEGFGFSGINNTTFNTTIQNTLNITVQWSKEDVQNSIYSDIFVLSKTF
jgi:hypothetical protein